jgi:hypothetical protein
VTELAQIVNVFGVAGVLAWFLWQIGPRLERVERAIDKLTRAQLLTVLGLPNSPEHVKKTVQRELDELEAKDK